MTPEKLNSINTTTLAYLGDAVYELHIREYLVVKRPNHVDKSHQAAIHYVSADGQAKAARKMMSEGFLSEDEERLLKRARNHRTTSKPSNADARTYKVATGFEALVGYLYLGGQKERLGEVIARAINIIEEN